MNARRPSGIRRGLFLSILAVLVLTGQSARAGAGVTVEATDVYCDSSGKNCSSIICIAEADNFRNGLLSASGTIFHAGLRYTNKLVYDTDFVDPDKTGHSFDNDTFNFDEAGNGVAYVCLHGVCNDTTSQTCHHASDCTHPGAGQSGPGVCINNGPPSNSAGWCAYYADRLMVTTADAFGNHTGGFINYSNGQCKWGETNHSGTWAAAGKNGGINFGLLSNSCGVRPGFVQRQLIPLFSGMTVLGIVMPVTPQGADDVDAPVRGTALSNAYRTNSNGSIAHAWTDSIVGIPYNDGSSCPFLDGNYTFGGGFGIAGCGAQLSHSLDEFQNFVLWDRDTQSWNQAIDDNNDATGDGWWAARWHCNYGCNTFPFNL